MKSGKCDTLIMSCVTTAFKKLFEDFNENEEDRKTTNMVAQHHSLHENESRKATMVPTLLLTINSRTFPGHSGLSVIPKTRPGVPALCRRPAIFTYTHKQQLLTLHIRCNNSIHRKIFIANCKETVRLARNTSHTYLHLFNCSIRRRHDAGYFEPRVNSISRTFQDQNHFPGLFRSSKFLE